MEQKEIKTGVNKVLIQSLGLSDKYLEKNILRKGGGSLGFPQTHHDCLRSGNGI